MRPRGLVLSLAALAAGLLATSSSLDARRGPRVRVQLSPLCNVLTLSVAEGDRGLTVAGYDDRCGVGAPSPISGRALRMSDGTLRLALYRRDGSVVQFVSLQLDVTGREGTWHDTAGRSGVAAAPGATARRRPSRGTVPFNLVPVDPLAGSRSGLFLPQFICNHGREFLGLVNSEFICSDVITPMSYPASDMALGSDGNPVFVGTGGGGGVVVTHCGNPACSAGNTPVAVSPTGYGGGIAIGHDGLPVVAIASAGTVTVVKCGDLGCTSGTQSAVSTSLSTFTLAIGSDGFPLIAGPSSGLVRVIHCGDAACTSGNTTVDLQTPHVTAVAPDIAIAPNGLPVVAFRYDVPRPYPEVEDGVKLHFCADLTCSTGTTSGPVMLNTLSQNNKFCCGLSLAIGSDGLAIVASHRMFWGLWTAHCDDGACGSSASGAKIDDWTLPGLSPDAADRRARRAGDQPSRGERARG